MTVFSAVDCPPGRRGCLRLSTGAIVLLAGLGAGPAAALLLDPVPIDNFVWGSNPTPYNNLVSTCPTVLTGGACPNPGPTEPTDAQRLTIKHSSLAASVATSPLYGWGELVNTPYHTMLTWINDGEPFVLDSISLNTAATAQPVGTGKDYLTSLNSPVTMGQGTGAAPTWEWADAAMTDIQLLDSQIAISVRTVVAGLDAVYNYTGYLFSNSPEIWFPTNATGPTGGPIQRLVAWSGLNANQLISGALLTAIPISQGATITFSLFEKTWYGATDGNKPDMQYASMQVGINAVNAPVPATLALLGLGLALLRPGRGAAHGHGSKTSHHG